MMGRMKFNAEQCVGCYACHMACLDAHHSAREIHARSFRGISKVMDEEKGLSYEICPGCTQCGACARACPQDAVFREEDYGVYLVDREKCIGCGVCTKACPNHLIFVDETGKAAKCDGCIARRKAGREPACLAVFCLDAITVGE